MDKENRTAAKFEEPTVRITRARAKALGSSGGLPPQKPYLKRDRKKVPTNAKRAVSDENQSAVGFLQSKKRAVLKEPSKQAKRIPGKKAKVAPAVLVDPRVQEDAQANISEHAVKERKEESQETKLPVNLKEKLTIQPSTHNNVQGCGVAPLLLVKQTSSTQAQLPSPSKKEKGKLCEKLDISDGPKVADIDSNHNDMLMCSLYAPDIYKSLSVTELDRRASINYMEMLQIDVTHTMRGILIDWLVEVSEEYELVPDTLYLTVNLIDRFLSKNYIEKQRLQLLGITCMLIASRFIQAAQTSYKVPRVELEFLANYLAELTLTEYGFLKFLPSLVAASAVFLARWTLDQSNQPWNPTLEHYTNYKAAELKPTVLRLQELQLNNNESSLNAIRDKYRQPKFKCVATLSSPKLVQSLFESLTRADPCNVIN
ncbi:hypothetical protein LguiB_012087 [Lonicera macranthoides]